jgi:putative endonuclease
MPGRQTAPAFAAFSTSCTSAIAEKSYAESKNYYVYLLSNWNNKVLYIGVTNDLERRIHEHKQKLIPGFTQKYNVSKLVYYEQTSDVISAISREKELKKWRREKKNALVNGVNQEWKDLSLDWLT